MPDPTEAHEFTFGCYRAVDVALDEPDRRTDASDTDHTILTDGGFAGAATCPSCESDLANVQGLPDCTHCAWNGR